MEIFVVWIVLSVLVAAYASNKGLSGVGFFFLSLLLSPLIGFIGVAVSSPDRQKAAEKSGMKKCPACAEYVQGEALICRYCQHQFGEGPSVVSTQPSEPAQPSKPIKDVGMKDVLTMLAVVAVVLGLIIALATFRDKTITPAAPVVSAQPSKPIVAPPAPKRRPAKSPKPLGPISVNVVAPPNANPEIMASFRRMNECIEHINSLKGQDFVKARRWYDANDFNHTVLMSDENLKTCMSVKLW